jgi:hypothetical protein
MTMMQGAHSDASAHSATGAHDMLAHPDLHAASAELGTTDAARSTEPARRIVLDPDARMSVRHRT